MAVCQRRKVRQPLRNQPDQAEKNTPSAYIHGSLDTGDMKHADISDDVFNMIPMTSPGKAPPFSDVTPLFVCLPGIPRAFDRGRPFVYKPIFVTESLANAKLELQAASTLCDHDIDVVHKIKHTRFARSSGSNDYFHEINSSAMGEPNAGVNDNDDDDAALHSRNTESCRTAQLDPEGREGVHYEPLVTAHGTVTINSSPTRVFITVVRAVRAVVTTH
ncbi:uncharacterized protein LOC142570962 [Dermacentor variabilis]|uniref:uncharacterized protein LOC142570962 n=1 Tax=Dermacentor variabilis TaxID=34621 RepID=UPI003F5BB2B9